jgi:hypothetical protein
MSTSLLGAVCSIGLKIKDCGPVPKAVCSKASQMFVAEINE